jgi:hypothetical protein
MCILKIKRTASGVPSVPLPRGQLAFDYATNTLFVGNSTNAGVSVGREVYGETGADLFFNAYDNSWPTQEATKTYIDTTLGQYGQVDAGLQYLGITANRQPVAYSETTDTVIEWSTSTIYEQSEDVGIQIYDENAPFYEGFFQTEVDLMYVRVSYNLFLGDIGQVQDTFPGADDYTNAARFCAIRLVNRADHVEYFGAQKIPPLTMSRNDLNNSERRATIVSGTAVVPLPRRTPENLWEIQIVTRWKTIGAQGFQFVGGYGDVALVDDIVERFQRKMFGGQSYFNENNYRVGYENGRGINVSLQRVYI